MKSNRRWIAFALLLGIFTAAGAYFYQSREPRFEGVVLSHWLRDCDIDRVELGKPAQEAVRILGTNALPALIAALGRRDSWLKHRLMGNCIEFRALGCRITAAYGTQVRAAAACRALGPKAQAAIPALLELSRLPVINSAAGQALVSIGPAAISPLLQELDDPAASYRTAAIGALAQFRPKMPIVVDALVRATHDAKTEVRRVALLSLQGIPADKEPSVVAALAEGTRDSDPNVRKYSIAILASATNTNPPPAVLKALRAAKSDADPEVARIAELSLRQTTPAAMP